MDILKLQEIFLICGMAVGGILFATLIFKRKSHHSYLLLSLILLLTITKQCLTVLITRETIELHNTLPYTALTFLDAVIIPLIYYYIWLFTHPLKRFNIVYLLSILFTGLAVATIFSTLEKNMAPNLTQHVDIQGYLGVIISAIIAVPLLWVAHKNILQFEKVINDNFSDISKIHLSWIKLIIFICFVLVGIDIIDIVAGPSVPLWKLSPIFVTISMFALTFFTLNYSKVFDVVAKNITETISSEPPFSPEDAKKYETKLLDFLDNQRPYLNTQFNLRDLSAGLGLKPYKTSELINSVLKTNFYTLINSKRVSHAKKLLLDQKSSHLNMLGIADQSGFNSKSVFNDAFKKMTGLTPKQFRAQNQQPI